MAKELLGNLEVSILPHHQLAVIGPAGYSIPPLLSTTAMEPIEHSHTGDAGVTAGQDSDLRATLRLGGDGADVHLIIDPQSHSPVIGREEVCATDEARHWHSDVTVESGYPVGGQLKSVLVPLQGRVFGQACVN